jgi:hypothetical protein
MAPAYDPSGNTAQLGAQILFEELCLTASALPDVSRAEPAHSVRILARLAKFSSPAPAHISCVGYHAAAEAASGGRR